MDIPLRVTTPENPVRGHKRWKSLDAVHKDRGEVPWLEKIPGMTAEPQVVAEVAKIFSKKVKLLAYAMSNFTDANMI
jgi:hypothetical protein